MKILLAGSQGQLGLALAPYAESRGHQVVALDRVQMDITNLDKIERSVDSHQPEIIVNSAAYTSVDKAETDKEGCFAINRDGVANLARVSRAFQIPLIHISSSFIFDGTKSGLYKETDEPNPVNTYGQSKLEGEILLRELCPKHILLRTSWIFGPDRFNFLKTVLRLAREKDELEIVSDQTGGPTYSGDLARVVVAIAEQLDCKPDDLWGTYNYCGTDQASWFQHAETILQEGYRFEDLRAKTIKPISTNEFPSTARRPQNSGLDCRKILSHFGIKQRPWKQGVLESLRFLAESENN